MTREAVGIEEAGGMEWLEKADLETEFRVWGLDGGAERELS